MAITVNPQINGQVVTQEANYAYLFEPYRIFIEESSLDATKIFIELEVQNTDSNSIVENISEYGLYDINPGQGITVNLMKLVLQYHDSNIFKYAHIDEIVENTKGWHSVISKYKYRFKITTDITNTEETITLLPIIGGRLFPDFVPLVQPSQVLTEAELHGVSLANRWLGYVHFSNFLNLDPDADNASPNISSSVSNGGEEVCGGYLVWKSIYGGWMSWGFEISKKKYNSKYGGNIKVGMFEGTEDFNGRPFIETDYTSVDLSYTLTLKSLSLSKDELNAVSGISLSPAIYYMKDNTGSLELMRLSSASVPLDNLANGGDFSVSLRNISQQSHETR